VTVLAVVQASSRHYARQRVDDEILVGLGVVRRQRLVAAALASVLPASVAALTAFVAAAVGSRWMPIGHARQFEPSPGLSVDVGALLPGALVLAALVVAAGALGRARVHVGNAARRDRRQPIRAVGRLADAGVGPPLAVGAQLALEPGAGRSAVPVRSALVGTTIGVTAVVAAATFGASLVRFLDTPARWGRTYDVAVSDVVDQSIANRLADDHDTAAFAVLDVASTRVEGVSTSALAIQVYKGSLPLTTLSGRLPVSPDEVALGSALLHDLGKRVGDEVRLGSAGQVARIVGDVVPPPDASPGLGRGVLLTSDGLAAVQDQAPYHEGLVRLRPGADRAAFTARLADLELNDTAAPTEVGNLAQLRRLPAVLAALLAAVAVASLANALTVAVRRRRRDLAVLRALGFTRRQAGATVGWMATVTAAIGLLVGVPLGIAAGSVVWRLVAGGLHVADDARVPALLAAVVAVTTVLLANLVAAVPAWRAARVRPAIALRAE
jgi:hypothetical protein